MKISVNKWFILTNKFEQMNNFRYFYLVVSWLKHTYRGFPEIDNSGIDGRIVLEQINSEKNYL